MTALLFLSFGLIAFNHHQNYLKPIRNNLNLAVMPVQYFVNWPVTVIDWLENSFTSRQTLLEQNTDLRAQLLILNAEVQKMLMLEQENAQLRALLQSQPRPNDRVLVAELLAVDPDPFVQEVVLNKGTRENVYEGQPVLDGSGVFGQVIQADPFTSRVMLIVDTRSAVPVQDKRSGVRGIVIGEGEGAPLKLINMPVTADIKVGDELITSGLGQCYPLGYPVGQVISIQKDIGQQFTKIAVKPNAKLYRSHLVLLIWPAFEKMMDLVKLSPKKEAAHVS